LYVEKYFLALIKVTNKISKPVFSNIFFCQIVLYNYKILREKYSCAIRHKFENTWCGCSTASYTHAYHNIQ